MQTNYNEVAVLQQGAGKVTGARKFVKKVNIHMRDIEMSGKMKRLKRKMEVQKITFNYFAWPQPRNWNFFYAMMMMAIQKILLSGFKICGYMGWPGWEWDFPAWNFVPVRPCPITYSSHALRACRSHTFTCSLNAYCYQRDLHLDKYVEMPFWITAHVDLFTVGYNISKCFTFILGS